MTIWEMLESEDAGWLRNQTTWMLGVKSRTEYLSSELRRYLESDAEISTRVRSNSETFKSALLTPPELDLKFAINYFLLNPKILA